MVQPVEMPVVHVVERDLEAFVEKTLPRFEMQIVEEHVHKCRKCARKVQEIYEAHKKWRTILKRSVLDPKMSKKRSI